MSTSPLVMPSCFIAMPLTTTDPALYHGDEDHFAHVLGHLLVPAVEEAGFTPLTPLAQGAEVIHAEIIAQLERSDLVLCDISGLNANVFFEMGVRTAINKPVCLIRDDRTPNIPFDTTLMNHHTYRSSLHPWELREDIDRLADHIRVTAQRSNGSNALWRHFGLSISAERAEDESDAESKLTLLARQVQTLSQRLGPFQGLDESDEVQRQRVFRHLREEVREAGMSGGITGWGGRVVNMHFENAPSDALLLRLRSIAKTLGYNIVVEVDPPVGTAESG